MRLANGSAGARSMRSRTMGVEAMFSATAIILVPRASRNSLVDWATETAATAISTTATTISWNARNCAARLRASGMFLMTRISFAFLCVT